MSEKMKVAYLTGIKQMEMGEMDKPTPKEDQVLIRLHHIGICGSDIAYVENGREDLVYPYILGHEGAGVVEKVGSAVTNLKVGDRVCFEPGRYCGKCKYCREGNYNLCTSMTFLATPPVQGCLQEYLAYPADMCFKLPENMSTIEGALVEPLAVGIHATIKSEIKPGQTAFIIGAGCIGLMNLIALKAAGAGQVIITETIPARREAARKFGADYVIDPAKEDPVAKVMALTDGVGADCVFECSNTPYGKQHSLEFLKRGGIIVMMGMGMPQPVAFDFMNLIRREVQIRGIFRYRHIYPAAIKLISSGKIDVKQMVSNIFEFEKTPEAFMYSIDHKAETVKGVIEFPVARQ